VKLKWGAKGGGESLKWGPCPLDLLGAATGRDTLMPQVDFPLNVE